MHFKYFIVNIMYLALLRSGFECQQTLPMPLLDKMQAALTANIDVTVLKDYINKEIQATVKTLKMNMEITAEKLNQSLEAQSKELTSTVSIQLRETTKATEAVKNKIKEIESKLEHKATKPRQGCKSGTIGDYAFPGRIAYPVSHSVTFDPPFLDTPAIVYGLYLLDSSKDHNVRLNTDVTNLSESGFTLTIITWEDTIMWGARFSWMACPK